MQFTIAESPRLPTDVTRCGIRRPLRGRREPSPMGNPQATGPFFLPNHFLFLTSLTNQRLVCNQLIKISTGQVYLAFFFFSSRQVTDKIELSILAQCAQGQTGEWGRMSWVSQHETTIPCFPGVVRTDVDIPPGPPGNNLRVYINTAYLLPIFDWSRCNNQSRTSFCLQNEESGKMYRPYLNQHRWTGREDQGDRDNCAEGTRQIDPVTSGEGGPCQP